jgi:hypothetical protein
MKLPILEIVVIGGLTLWACSPKEETESPEYQNGYEEGLRAGHRATCGKIEQFNSNIKDALVNQGIC